MRAGRLNRKIAVEQKTATRDAAGQPIETWSIFAEPWASVEPQGGKEEFTADQLQNQQVTRFRLRYLSGVTTQMRVNYGGVLYDIQSVVHTDDRRRETLLLATARHD